MPLTDDLIAKRPDQLRAATTHSFLSAAGAGTLAEKPLCAWLVQDKYYQFAYVNFIGRLISKLDLSSYAFPADNADKGGKTENLAWKTLNTLIGALNAIKGEIDFYNETVEKYGLVLQEEGPNEVTRKYVQLFEESSAVGKPVVWGLTVLWATEFCYLKAWTFAKEHQAKSYSSSGSGQGEAKGALGALHKEFIPNWTSDDFQAAVDGLADVTNSWAAETEKGEESNCDGFWQTTLDLETKFWPNE